MLKRCAYSIGDFKRLERVPPQFHSFQLFVLLLQLIAAISPHLGYGQKQLGTPIMAYNHSFTTVNGLSQNNVTSILKDKDGFMWISTGEGIDRFDGYSFVNFVHSDRDSSSLSNNAVKNMLLDSKGQLWVGTYNGLNLYDNKKETFRKFLFEPPDDYTTHSAIFSLLEDRHHQLWVASYGTIYKIDIETFAIKKYDYRNDSTGLAAAIALLEDRNGKIWAATRRGISILNSEGVVERTLNYKDTHGSSPNDMVVCMAQDVTGALYFGSNGMGVLRLNDENDKTFKHFTSEPDKPFFGSDIIGSLAIDKDGKLLVGTDGAGIYKQDDDGNFRQILGNQSRHLRNSNIVNIFVNDDNSYWLGLFGGGLQIVYAGSRRFEHYRYFDLHMERIEKNSVLAIAEDQHQKIWIGTDGAGLYKFDPQTELFTSYRHSSTNKNSVSSNVVKSLAVDEKNNLYAGTFGGGLNYLDTKTGSFSRYIHIPGNNVSISTNHVWSLLEASNHAIYAGQLAALDEFFPHKKVFKPLPIPGSIFSMEEDPGGNIWIGARLDGLHRYQPKTKTLKSFFNIPGDSASMPTNEIADLTINFQGKLWIGTANKGLILFDPEKFNFERIAPLKEKHITNVLEDDSHNVWFTSVDGLHKFDPATSLVYDYTVADGLQGTQFNEGARLKSSDGTCYLGGTNGLNVFRPEDIIDDTIQARVVFTQLTLFNTPVNINDKSGLLTQSISQTESISLQPDQNVFSLEFACLEFNFPKKTKYRYYLEGFDKAWNDANTSRMATYTNLPPGGYTLRVSTSNRSGHWSESAASIKIIVIPKWYERSETKYGAAILMIILTVLIIHLRTKLLFKQKIKLEHLVAKRTEELEQTNEVLVNRDEEIQTQNNELFNQREELASQNEQLQSARKVIEKQNNEIILRNESLEEEIKNRTKELVEYNQQLEQFAFITAHNLRAPVARILGLGNVLEFTSKGAEDERLIISKLIFATGELDAVVKDLSTILDLRKNNTSLITEVSLQQELRLIKENLEKEILETHAEIKEDFSKAPFIRTVKPYLDSILINLISNAIKYRHLDRRPLIQIKSEAIENKICLTVSDNGLGIDLSSYREKLFTLYSRFHNHVEGKGMGLYLVKTQVVALGGKIEVESEIDHGTTFRILFLNQNLPSC